MLCSVKLSCQQLSGQAQLSVQVLALLQCFPGAGAAALRGEIVCNTLSICGQPAAALLPCVSLDSIQQRLACKGDKQCQHLRPIAEVFR